jgi:hypothetical protein
MKRFILVLVLVIGAYGSALASEPAIEEGFKAFKKLELKPPGKLGLKADRLMVVKK